MHVGMIFYFVFSFATSVILAPHTTILIIPFAYSKVPHKSGDQGKGLSVWTGRTTTLEMSAKSFLEQAAAFRVVRSENYRGPTSRGGRRHVITSTNAAPSSATIAGETSTPSQVTDLWEKLAVAAGGDRQAEIAVASMQRSLLEMVENMPIDEIELLAGK